MSAPDTIATGRIALAGRCAILRKAVRLVPVTSFLCLVLGVSHGTPITPQIYRADVTAFLSYEVGGGGGGYSEGYDYSDAWWNSASAYARGPYSTMAALAWVEPDARPQFEHIVPDPRCNFFQLTSIANLWFANEFDWGWGVVSQVVEMTLWSEYFILAWNAVPIGESEFIFPIIEGVERLTVLNVTQSTTLLDLQFGSEDPWSPFDTFIPYEGVLYGNVGDVIRISFSSDTIHHMRTEWPYPHIGEQGLFWQVSFGAPVPEPATVVLLGIASLGLGVGILRRYN